MSLSERSIILNRLKEDLLGPVKADEQLEAYPSDIYLTGILFPPRNEVPEEERDQLQAEGKYEADSGDSSKDEVSLATVKRPASAGLSFVVDSQGRTPAIRIVVRAGAYERILAPDDGKEDLPAKIRKVWQRKQLEVNMPEIALDFASQDFTASDTGVTGLGMHIRTSPWDNHRLLVTVAIINENQLSEEYERETIEPKCFFQTEISVKPGKDTQFCPRPLGGSAIDEDTLMAQLIYRDVEEYAVGHTCSATWIEEGSLVSEVLSTWLPDRVVKAMSSEGVKDFLPLSDEKNGPVLSTEWLAQTQGDKLITGLELLPQLYQDWLDEEHKKVATLAPDLQAQANKHLENAGKVRQRMLGAIGLIKDDKNVQTAFRLANQAILLQRRWAQPDSQPLMWRPFQLGFILLTLESLADPRHKDRQVADLLWFPTGGGKTEAYLGLIAFILFLRRLRHDLQGCGVGSFMRYTLRLLTVQQFQRAASLICACDSLRQGHDLPAGIALNGPDIPISLGLWVGGDTTPNDFKKAREALHNETAHNRPDQLSVCPKHRNQKLQWRADETRKEIIANCPETSCIWHTRPLPIWTVDDNVYEHQPSLIIGTIDKFAQIARNPQTPRLFGRGNSSYLQPDLIIQDELHLISGPLGTIAGIYEIAIDKICSENGSLPKIIASTATIRQADTQIKALFNRQTCLFPPPVLDATNSGFAVEDTKAPGRLYAGITTAGRSAKFALQAIAASLLQSATSQDLREEYRDDFWTLVSYFNSLRELGGALVLMQDDVGVSLQEYAGRHGENPRQVKDPMELTSRVSSSEIKDYLLLLEKSCQEPDVCDVVLASNMISVGVDVPRLGTMIVNGQPKGIAEYIQATSRVGRRNKGPGGLVVTIYNNAKSRDRSHFETFNTWHQSLYREVEATSVTPFAPRARDKALHAALIILARHLIPDLNSDVKRIEEFEDELEEFIDYISQRANDIDPDEVGPVESKLQSFLEKWLDNAENISEYWNDYKPQISLMLSAEKASEIKARDGIYYGRATPTPNSMRNVEAGTVFILKEKLERNV